MKFLADESVDRHIVDLLQVSGFEVLYIAEINAGISDIEVLSIAKKENALLITADKDFGELVYRQGLMVKGVILIRLAGLSPEIKSEITVSTVKEHIDELSKSFSVITHNAIRIRHWIERE
ncbi:protein of unknown function DUF82 [Candidatus Magnetoovum chiemensis]|nr:protein of unknown function DUF82 [Candidatus Magnetoovum chiemensis]